MKILRLITVLTFLFCSTIITAKDYNASMFGIKSNGTTLNTNSIQKGIDFISANGGGRLVFYVGRYLTGTIYLKSHSPDFICQNVYVHNNTVRTSANGIKFGTASYGGFRNIKIINNLVFDTYRSAITFAAVDGGVVEDMPHNISPSSIVGMPDAMIENVSLTGIKEDYRTAVVMDDVHGAEIKGLKVNEPDDKKKLSFHTNRLE